MSINRVQQWASFARLWWIYDARFQCPLKSAYLLGQYLHGKHKPIYHPLSDLGDHVVVINTRHIAMEGEYWRTWHFHHDTGYPGGKTETPAYKAHDKDPTFVMRKFVYSTLKGNLSRRAVMERLHLFPEEEVPDNILKNVSGQIRQVMPAPVRLDEYSPEIRQKFPRLFKWPEDHVVGDIKGRPVVK